MITRSAIIERADPAFEYIREIPVLGWITPAEAALLSVCACGRVVLELGSYMGRSTVAMAPHAKHIYCVDHFHPKSEGQGYDPQSEGVLGEFLSNIAPWKHKIAYIQAMTEDALAISWPPIGLLFVDAGHRYLEAMHDLEFIRFLVPGGIVAVHDTEKPGPRKAIANSIMMHECWQELYPVGTMRAFVKP
jgi:hypothetical protein